VAEPQIAGDALTILSPEIMVDRMVGRHNCLSAFTLPLFISTILSIYQFITLLQTARPMLPSDLAGCR
jgi:hypothetical protein